MGTPFALGYFERRRHSAAMDLASAALTAGMTFSAISSMVRWARFESSFCARG
jgi:hypothetical protein